MSKLTSNFSRPTLTWEYEKVRVYARAEGHARAIQFGAILKLMSFQFLINGG